MFLRFEDATFLAKIASFLLCGRSHSYSVPRELRSEWLFLPGEENLQFVIHVQDGERRAFLVELLRSINGTGLGIHEYPEEYCERARHLHTAGRGQQAKIGEVDYHRHPRGTWEIDT